MWEKFKFNFMLYLISFLCFSGGTIYLAALPELSLLFQVSSSMIKFSLTIFFIGLIAGTLLVGPLSEIYGRLSILIFFLFLFTAGSLLACFATTINLFLVARFIQGVGIASGPLMAIALVADRYEGTEYRKYLAYVIMMIGLGGGIGPILGSLILHFFTWKSIFYFLTALGILALLLVFSTLQHVTFKKRKMTEIFHEYGFFLKHPFFRHYCLMIGILHGGFYTFMIIIPYIFRLHYGWGIMEFAWVGFAIAISQSFGAILDKHLFEKIGGMTLLLAGLSTIATALLLFLALGLPYSGVSFLLISGLFAMGISICVTILIGDAEKVHPEFSGIASSLINLAKITFISLALIFVIFLPDTLGIIEISILITLILCLLLYLRIRQSA